MFNKDATNFLALINKVTNSLILKYPRTVAMSEDQDIRMIFDISELDPEQFDDIGLKDSLDSFLKLSNLFPEDRSISIDANTINISHDKLQSAFITDNLALMDAYDKDEDQFTKTEGVPSVASFVITPDDIDKISKACGVFKDLSEIMFTSQDSDMIISLGASNRFNARSNKFSITKSANTSKEFELKIPVENFQKLPSSEYTIDVKYNQNKDSYRILLTSKSFESFKILMSVKA